MKDELTKNKDVRKEDGRTDETQTDKTFLSFRDFFLNEHKKPKAINASLFRCETPATDSSHKSS